MNQFTTKYTDKIQGVLSGFDRLVFRGSLRKIAYVFVAAGLRIQSLLRFCGLPHRPLFVWYQKVISLQQFFDQQPIKAILVSEILSCRVPSLSHALALDPATRSQPG